MHAERKEIIARSKTTGERSFSLIFGVPINLVYSMDDMIKNVYIVIHFGWPKIMLLWLKKEKITDLHINIYCTSFKYKDKSYHIGDRLINKVFYGGEMTKECFIWHNRETIRGFLNYTTHTLNAFNVNEDYIKQMITIFLGSSWCLLIKLNGGLVNSLQCIYNTNKPLHNQTHICIHARWIDQYYTITNGFKLLKNTYMHAYMRNDSKVNI